MWTMAAWVLPLISASSWLLTLFTIFGYWASLGSPIYSSMNKGQTIPYISDIAASEMQPVFMIGSFVSVLLLNIFLICKSRHARQSIKVQGKRHGTGQTRSTYLSIVLTAAGSIGLILLARFDRLQYPDLHRTFLKLYVASFSIAAAVASLEYLLLCMRSGWRHQLLITAFTIRLCTSILAATLGLVFWYAQRHTEITRDFCAVIEWVLGVTFAGHIACFAFDLLPLISGLRKGEYMELV